MIYSVHRKFLGYPKVMIKAVIIMTIRHPSKIAHSEINRGSDD